MLRFILCLIGCLGFLLGFSSLAQADLLDWSSNNIQLLRGEKYKLGSEERTIATFEHAHGWKYGDTFIFIDQIWPEGDDSTYYTEISPRLSLSKIFNKDFSNNFVKDVLISTTLEKPKGQGPRYLYGGAVDLNVPGFKFFKTNAYFRDDTQLEGHTWQVTLVWNAPFEIGPAKFLVEGFADISGGEDNKEANEFVVPRLLLDVGHFWDKSDRLFVGVEYSYWHNKFGISGTTESVPQAMIKWVF